MSTDRGRSDQTNMSPYSYHTLLGPFEIQKAYRRKDIGCQGSYVLAYTINICVYGMGRFHKLTYA